MDTKECYICYEPLNNIKELKCHHKFHVTCISRWLENNITCPICREVVVNIRDYFPEYIKELFVDFDNLEILNWKNNYVGYTGYIDSISTIDVKQKISIGIDNYRRPFICFNGKIVENNGKFELVKSRRASTLFQRYCNDPFTYVFANKTGDLLFNIDTDLKIINDIQST